MSDVILSPNMNLPVPIVGQDPGPDWATNINASLSILDQHDHSAGSGVQVTPSGLNINSDLAFQSTNAYQLRSARFINNDSTLAEASDLTCVYVSGGNLYYNNASGTAVQITSGSSVNAGAGSITGLPSGTASVTFSAGTYVFQSATSTSAVLDGGSIILRNNTASSKGLTLSPPNAMAADYGLNLPALPASQSFVTLDTSGNIAAYAPINQGITRSNLTAVGQQVSSSSGSFSTTSVSEVAVTNLSVSITTTGRPVVVLLQPNQSVSGSIFITTASGTTTASFAISVYRDISGTPVKVFSLAPLNTFAAPPSNPYGLTYPASSVYCIDTTATAGAHTYTVYAQLVSPGTLQVSNCVLVAYEL